MKSIAGAVFLAIVASIALADAPDGNPATSTVPMVLPYEGFLAIDGAPVDLPNVAVRFFLCGRPDQDLGQCWSQQLNVAFHGGRFSVLLGPGADTPLGPAILDADDLYVRVQIGGTTLAGAQRIVPVPYAQWSGNAADLHVAGPATLGSDLHVVGSTTLDGTVDVQGVATMRGGIRLPAGVAGGDNPLRGLNVVDPGIAFSLEHGGLIPLIPVSAGFCFITDMITAPNGTSAECNIGTIGANWALGNDNSPFCHAKCVRWDGQ